jgi:hypothetical protein
LFAGLGATLSATRVRVVRTHDALVKELFRTVRGAKEQIVCTGSRSREPEYLDEIVKHITENRRVKHTRVLWGPPQSGPLIRHLKTLSSLRDASKQAKGQVRLAMYEDVTSEPELAICASERTAMVIVAALGTYGAYDSAVVFTRKQDVSEILDYVDRLHANARVLTDADVNRLSLSPAPASLPPTAGAP